MPSNFHRIFDGRTQFSRSKGLRGTTQRMKCTVAKKISFPVGCDDSDFNGVAQTETVGLESRPSPQNPDFMFSSRRTPRYGRLDQRESVRNATLACDTVVMTGAIHTSAETLWFRIGIVSGQESFSVYSIALGTRNVTRGSMVTDISEFRSTY